jgi:hypothetical protein
MPNVLKNIEALKIPRKTQPMKLGEYHEDLGESVLHVWVNLTKAMHDRYADWQEAIRDANQEAVRIDAEHRARAEKAAGGEQPDPEYPMGADLLERMEANNHRIRETINPEIFAWYSEVWSQAPDEETHLAPEQVREMAEHLKAQDPALWAHITQGTQALIIAHRNSLRKN